MDPAPLNPRRAQATVFFRGLVSAGCDPLLPFPDGSTPLHLACQRGYVDITELLLARGADASLFVRPGLPTPVALATRHERIFSKVLDSALALHVAPAEREEVRGCCLFLFPTCADRDSTQILQVTLAVASGEAQLHAVRELLARGAHPGKPGGPSLGEGLARVTPLQLLTAAANADHAYAVAKLLLERGADPHDKGGSQLFPLTDAIDASSLGVVRALLEFGVPVHEGDDEQVSSLTRAAARNSPDLVRLLLDHGADVDGGGLHAFGSSLYQSIISGPKCTELLLKAGANLDIRTPKGLSPLHVAVEMCDTQLLELLLEHGADPNAHDSEGRSPLDYSVRQLHFECFVVLLEYDADPARANRHANGQPKITVVADQDDDEDGSEDEIKPLPALASAAASSGQDAPRSVDVMEWLGEREQAAYGAEALSPPSKLVDCFGAFSKALNDGYLWPTWTKVTHHLFPKNVRRAIVTTLLCWKRGESELSRLPKWLMPMVLGYVATRSKVNEVRRWTRHTLCVCVCIVCVFVCFSTTNVHEQWRRPGAPKEEWGYTPAFMDLISRRNTDYIVSPEMLRAIEDGVCTKHVTGGGFEPQPFYNCVECGMNPRARANLGICASCVKMCHQGHRVFLNSVQPAFCDCGESARCQIMDRLLAVKIDESEESEHGYLVVIKTFPERLEGQRLLPGVPGEVIRVKRDECASFPPLLLSPAPLSRSLPASAMASPMASFTVCRARSH